MSIKKAFHRMYKVIKTLRAPGGCPWDIEQTPNSMLPCLIEETFETVDAVSSNDSLHAKEELGDVFFNAMMMAYMYEQQGDFSVEQAVGEVTDKIILRHPHVFGKKSSAFGIRNSNVDSGEKVIAQWDKIKDKVEGRETECILDQVPAGFPPLMKSYKYVKKVTRQGFDWENADRAEEKLLEELEELRNARCNGNQEEVTEEAGDLLFAAVTYLYKLGVDPNVALEKACSKFYKRYSFVEKETLSAGKQMKETSLEEKLALWKKAKDL